MASNLPQSSAPDMPVPEVVDSPTLASQPGNVNQGIQNQQAEDSAAQGMIIESQAPKKDAAPGTKTPEPHIDPQTQAQNLITDASPNAPGHVPSFDWDHFEQRFEAALDAANNNEREVLEEFDSLVKVCAAAVPVTLAQQSLTLPAVL